MECQDRSFPLLTFLFSYGYSFVMLSPIEILALSKLSKLCTKDVREECKEGTYRINERFKIDIVIKINKDIEINAVSLLNFPTWPLITALIQHLGEIDMKDLVSQAIAISQEESYPLTEILQQEALTTYKHIVGDNKKSRKGAVYPTILTVEKLNKRK